MSFSDILYTVSCLGCIFVAIISVLNKNHTLAFLALNLFALMRIERLLDK